MVAIILEWWQQSHLCSKGVAHSSNYLLGVDAWALWGSQGLVLWMAVIRPDDHWKAQTLAVKGIERPLAANSEGAKLQQVGDTCQVEQCGLPASGSGPPTPCCQQWSSPAQIPAPLRGQKTHLQSLHTCYPLWMNTFGELDNYYNGNIF